MNLSACVLDKQISLLPAVFPASVTVFVVNLEPRLSTACSRVILQPEIPTGIAVLPLVAPTVRPTYKMLNILNCADALQEFLYLYISPYG